MWRTALLTPFLFLLGCGTGKHDVSVAGGQAVQITKKGDAAARVENDQVSLSVPQLTIVKQEGNDYVRWWFRFRQKQPVQLRSVRIDDITGGTPLPLISDQAPQLKGNDWVGFSGLIDATAAGSPWLYDQADTTRVFQFTFTDLNGNSYSLNQGFYLSRRAKETLRKANGL